MNFEQLQDWFSALPKHSELGSTAYCPTGAEYKSFVAMAYCRPGDEKEAEASACEMMQDQLKFHMKHNDGIIYVRTPLECGCQDYPKVLREDPKGPDLFWDKRCYLSHDWRLFRIYCRLVKD